MISSITLAIWVANIGKYPKPKRYVRSIVVVSPNTIYLFDSPFSEITLVIIIANIAIIGSMIESTGIPRSFRRVRYEDMVNTVAKNDSIKMSFVVCLNIAR